MCIMHCLFFATSLQVDNQSSVTFTNFILISHIQEQESMEIYLRNFAAAHASWHNPPSLGRDVFKQYVIVMIIFKMLKLYFSGWQRISTVELWQA